MSFARVRALAVLTTLVICAAVTVAVTLVKDRQRGPALSHECPKGAVVADLRLPQEKDVKVRVLNATNTAGLASRVATDFRNRKFQVVKYGNYNKRRVTSVALLRYGPKTVGATWLLRAYFLNEAEIEFNKKRTDNVVDVLVGSGFKQLATVTEFHQALAQLGKPVLPDGTCELKH